MNLSTKQKQTYRCENNLLVAKGEGNVEGWDGSLGLAEANNTQSVNKQQGLTT